jgi:pyruvate dehydrogenase E2 component (dihydrolipoamide acetyltransferase)
MSGEIHALVIPKYGMVMTHGVLATWHVQEGAVVRPGDEIIDIETEKIANAYETPVGGVLRRRVAEEGETLPCGSLFGVVSDESVADADIDAFIKEFQANFSAAEAAGNAAQPQVIEADDLRIRYLRAGEEDGVPIVLLHGFGGDLNNWLFNQEALAVDRYVYALDLPGHGGSQKSLDVVDIAALTAAVRACLRALEISKVHLVGHSLGGAIALSLAMEAPGLVASATLLAPAGLGTQINGAFIKGMVETERRKEMQTVLQDLFHDPALISRDLVMNVLKAKRVDGAMPCLRKLADNCFPLGSQKWQAREKLAAVAATVPLQVIWGAHDLIIPASHATGVPDNVAVHVLEDAGHMVHMERASEVNTLIQRLVETTERRMTQES